MNFAGLRTAVLRGAVPEVHGIVANVLTRIVSCELDVRAVRHPLGFACLPIHRLGAEGICVHVWPPDRAPARLTTSPFHCHSWQLLSQVLYGTVGNQRVHVFEGGSTYRMFTVHSKGEVDELIATDRFVDARAVPAEYWEAGQHYDLPAGEFHASALLPGVAAATVVLGLHDVDRPDLTLGGIDTPSHRVEREFYSDSDCWAIAADVLRGMSGAVTDRSGELVSADAE
ncbi:hypothetical protein DFJ67_2989 [Asanoa ferruginea]|uniref:Uncharacterized protein n=1 Tax=Asanoa ferruginea TaxID=53367 RepID=A0A3D9ZKA8_9ACTN|nr:hypothetical protein [Asanoa ferruginea]REF96994.1 hypothetical protein DFJ67_2989 [Asanoa ferruginea]GIF50184.1 hypothetical protein Afe04nite_47230 [Asanoa ferruginea]